MSWLRSVKRTAEEGAVAAEGSRQAPSKRRLIRKNTPVDPSPPGRLSAEDILNGDTLTHFAKRAVHCAILHCGRPSLQGELKIGSLCSGSEMLSACLHALTSCLRAEQVELELRTPFCCEADPLKRKWCIQVANLIHGQDSGNICAHTDVAQFLEGAQAMCQRHGAKCNLPQLDGLVAGTSCKDSSRANPNRKTLATQTIVGASSSPGKSADTLAGALSVIDHRAPEFILLENVDTLTEADHCDGLDHLFHQLACRGWLVACLGLIGGIDQ